MLPIRDSTESASIEVFFLMLFFINEYFRILSIFISIAILYKKSSSDCLYEGFPILIFVLSDIPTICNCPFNFKLYN